MSDVVIPFEVARAPAPAPERRRLPDETPLHMPRQRLDAHFGGEAPTPVTSPANVAARRALFFAATFLLAGIAAMVPYDLYEREGLTLLETVGMGLFSLLILGMACWFCSAAAGFFVLLNRREGESLRFRDAPGAPRVRTALLMPLYNEDVDAALRRLTALDNSLGESGAAHAFDLFILSDTTDEALAEREWASFRAFAGQTYCRAYYRRRAKNTERKAGNIGDWVQRFGGAYEHMIILDADSTMCGRTVLHLVDAMERNPGVGLIQTTPAIVNAGTLYARSAQFGVRLFGRVAAAGLAWWTGSEGSYWGHNAILRVQAFADCCNLPIIPGRKPFGGHVLSHDVVEAALLRRGGWAVHVTAALGGSFEETPPSLADFVVRDRRWCQGNLQHLKLLQTPGLHWVSRLQFLMGCMAYLAAPLWFAFLLVGLAIQMKSLFVDPIWIIAPPDLTPILWTTMMTAGLLFGPKIMGWALVMLDPRQRRAFGGGKALTKGLATEMVLSALLAPVLMVAHTRIVIQILSGKDAGWTRQKREAEALSLREAFRIHRWEFNAGLLMSAALALQPDLILWFAPIVIPLLLSAPLAVLTARSDLGALARRHGLLLTPEEVKTPALLAEPDYEGQLMGFELQRAG